LKLFRSRVIEWILRDRISFHEIQSEYWREMITGVRSEAISVIFKSSNIMRIWVMNHFKASWNIIKCHLNEIIFKIHIFCDMWISLNDRFMFEIIAHWIQINKSLRLITIKLFKVRNAYIKTNIINAFVDVLKKYEIIDKFKYIMLNNVINNDMII